MGARLKFWRRSRVPKKGSRDEAVFLAALPLVTAPPSNITRLYHNGSAAKSHSTTTQYHQLRRLEKTQRCIVSLRKNSMGYCVPIDQWGYSLPLNFFMSAQEAENKMHWYI